MRDVVLVEPVSATVITVDSKDMLEEVHHDSIRSLHLGLLVALSAWQILRSFIIFTDISLQ